MNRVPRSWLALIAVALVGYALWTRLRIVFWVHLSAWQALLLFGGVALVLYLLLDHLFNRTRV